MGCGGSSREEDDSLSGKDQSGTTSNDGPKKIEEMFGLLTDSQVSMICRNMFCYVFGMEEYEKQGYFVEHQMIQIVYPYQDWVRYPIGDHVLKGHTDVVSGLAISEDGRHLYTCSWDTHITHWDLLTNQMIHKWGAHSAIIHCITLHRRGWLATGSIDGGIKIWNAINYQMIRFIKESEHGVNSLQFNKQGDRIISGSYDGCLRERYVRTGQMTRCIRSRTGWIESMIMTNDTIAVIGTSTMEVRGWDLTENIKIFECDESYSAGVTGLCLNSDRTLLASCSSNEIVIWEMPNMDEEYLTIECSVMSIAFSANHPHILAIAMVDDIQVQLLDVSRDHCFHSVLNAHDSGIKAMSFTPDGYRLISISKDSTVKVWDIMDVIHNYELSKERLVVY